jgi:hypothetical protein
MNLDDLAKLAPFLGRTIPDNNCYVVDADGHALEPEEVEAALNEWAELRAYRERTEAALRELCRTIDEEKSLHEFRGPTEQSLSIVTGAMMLGRLWRDPAPKEATDGR